MISFSADTLTIVGVVLGSGIAALFVFLLLVYAGFRMGRQVAEKPMQPIFEKKSEPLMIEEDPYFEAMHGHKQNRIPTVDGGKV